jgi:site-specific recombinase XerD
MQGTPFFHSNAVRLKEHLLLLESFRRWLSTLEYAASTVYVSANYVRDFLIFLEGHQVSAREITPEIVRQYGRYLESRANKRHAGALSVNYITSNLNAIRRLSRYVAMSGHPALEIPPAPPVDKEPDRAIFSVGEIAALYRAASSDSLGARDRAMLGIYYGCGLRRSEGISLEVGDVLIKQRLVYVKKGKGYRQRYVPMSLAVAGDLEEYIRSARLQLQVADRSDPALFLSLRGRRMSGNSLVKRLERLKSIAAIDKPAGLHSLRHSIATHLLQSGMSLESVSRFLGHSSLESTQIYTHLAHEP